MATVKTAKKKPTPSKEPDHSSEEDESDFYTDEEYSSLENDQQDESRRNSNMTSETESIQREVPAHGDRRAPTTEVIRRETNTAVPAQKGIAPIQPLAERTGPIAKDAGSALSLRLDLNLDVEVELKAKIRGDLTLSLL
ncbi:hypothetical protein PENANT_c035G04632 [Penicillium antarcticum]|uniref:Uncharacterized protein n=1 Tax=Penicillium antarcticum TaxID=416450 RepID=A0A1V6PU28_9EURO|nr:hypothetical protein PENANT_c035G04632 [Penicillium antarcticum]